MRNASFTFLTFTFGSGSPSLSWLRVTTKVPFMVVDDAAVEEVAHSRYQSFHVGGSLLIVLSKFFTE